MRRDINGRKQTVNAIAGLSRTEQAVYNLQPTRN
jgi:hypothetical protein